MKNPIFISIFFALMLATSLQAQDKLSWKKHVKLAEELYAKAQYADAGDHYRSAFKLKTKKKEFAYKAGECFYIIRDYRNAADAWKNVKDDASLDPLVGLRYARCLKQNGEYEAASSELVNFVGHYQGADKTVVSQIVQNELRGCELAAQLSIKGDDPNITVAHLGSNVNTLETEFAPCPYGDEALYFSSTMAKRAEIYRSIKSNGSEWGKATPIENFPVIENDHFCNGNLSADATRFYFTICKSKENWGGLTTQCEIFVTRRVGKTWTSPERLPDYVNEGGSSTTHPFVVKGETSEVLYFASNRKGGMGGMDIWYTTRDNNSSANDFTLPINCGSRINTIGDEITPFFDNLEGNLYFASNGQTSMGGYDIFSVKGAKSQWEKPNNAGTPLNSPADDFFFVKTSSGKGGFFVSNRTFESEKVTTTDEDIFSFTYNQPTRQWVAKGEVFDKASRSLVSNAEVSIYEFSNSGQKRFLNKMISEDGTYSFTVEPSRKYALEALKDGFFPAVYEFDTYDFANYSDFGAPIYMEGYDQTGGEEPVAVKENPKTNPKEKEGAGGMKKVVVKEKMPSKEKPVIKPPVKEEEVAEKTETGNKEKVEKPKPASAKPKSDLKNPTSEGTYYKIQIIAIGKYDASHPRYSKVKNMGRIDTEHLAERKLYRVLVGDYASLEDALTALPDVRAEKDFGTAFIVEYRDGERIGDVK